MRLVYVSSPEDAVMLLKRIGVDPYGIQAMVPKMKTLNIFLEGIQCKVANILKQEMLSLAGDVAVARGSVACSIEKTDAVVIGTVKQLRRLVDKIALQPFGLQKISEEICKILDNLSQEIFVLKTPEREIRLGKRTCIMGILNVTPDSFSDGGMLKTCEDAVEKGLRLEAEGADIIDIGGESSRPGALPVASEEELKRVIPVIQQLKKRIRIPISVDTTKAEVARRALDVGAEIVNDISALTLDKMMLDVVVSRQVPVVLMHMRGVPLTMQQGDLVYTSLMGEILNFLEQRINVIVKAGFNPENVIVDPGIGFGKSVQDNIQIIRRLTEMRTLGKAVLMGTSRKNFIGRIGGGMPHDRIEGTAATVAASIMNGAHIVRVHDVGFMRKVATMMDEIVRKAVD